MCYVPVVLRSPFVRSFVHLCFARCRFSHISCIPYSTRYRFSAWRCMSICYQLSGYIVHYDDSCQLTSKIPKLSDAYTHTCSGRLIRKKKCCCLKLSLFSITYHTHTYIVLYQSVVHFPFWIFFSIKKKRFFFHYSTVCIVITFVWFFFFGV